MINRCLQDARNNAKQGVIVVTNPDTSWTPGKDIFLKNGFQLADTAPFQFELLVYQFEQSSSMPFFPADWDERISKFDDLTIMRSFQCPYVDIAAENIITSANKLGIPLKIIDFKHREELMELSPTPYGVFSVIYKKKLISFHRLTVHSAVKRLKGIM
ncbi:hypothetical protein [Cytobacillus oceanisediminis]|uniref:hypothetical protein n=1 Tax=Cytobacillus oceanisediminis TaxID=665099 RepID=UPI0032612B3D